MAPGQSFARLNACAREELPSVQEQSASSQAPASTKRGRGPTVGLGLEKINKSNGKLIIDVDVEKGRPTDSVQSSKLASEIGIISRGFIQPKRKWKEVDPSALTKAFDRIEERFIVDVDEPHVRKSCEGQLQARLRGRRHTLHKKFLSFNSESQARENPPEDVTREDWEELCDMWTSNSWKAWSRANKENRKKVKTVNTLGSKSYVVAREQLRDKETKEEKDPIEFYRLTHHEEGKGWQSEKAESNYAAMLGLMGTPNADGSGPLTSEEIVKMVLGKSSTFTKSLGYVVGSSSSTMRSANVALQNELEQHKKQLAATNELVTELSAQQKKYIAFISMMFPNIAPSIFPPDASNISSNLSPANFPPPAPNAAAFFSLAASANASAFIPPIAPNTSTAATPSASPATSSFPPAAPSTATFFPFAAANASSFIPPHVASKSPAPAPNASTSSPPPDAPTTN